MVVQKLKAYCQNMIPKVKKNYLFYIALSHKKKGDEVLASEKLKEAHAMTGMNNDSFIGSQPFKDKEILSNLKSELDSISLD